MPKNESTVKTLGKANNTYKRLFEGKDIVITIENASEVKIGFSKDTFPYLVGVSSEYYSRTPLYKSFYHFLEHLILNPAFYQEKICKGEIPISNIYSPYCKEKAKLFNRTKTISTSSVPFIFKYNNLAYSNLGNRPCTYYAFFETDKEEMSGYLIGFKYSAKISGYDAVVLLRVRDKENLENILGNQQIHLTSEISVKTKGKSGREIMSSSSEELEEKRERYGFLNVFTPHFRKEQEEAILIIEDYLKSVGELSAQEALQLKNLIDQITSK